MLRVLFVIDTLGSGGAQRQLCELAKLLVKRGCYVKVIAYHNNSFFTSYLETNGVEVNVAERAMGRFKRLLFVWKNIRQCRSDVVCAFLPGPGLAIELGKFFKVAKFRTVTSERHLDSAMSLSVFTRFVFHYLSDIVIANSFSQAKFINNSAPWLRRKLLCIRNCVDTERFSPVVRSDEAISKLQVLVLASYTDNKNILGLLRGVRKAVDIIGDDVFVVKWYGNTRSVIDSDGRLSQPLFDAACQLRKDLNLDSVVELNGDTNNVEILYRNSDIFCLPSFSEATPNVICEAMASGLPIIASKVGDIDSIVIDGENGFLFDPKDDSTISCALQNILLMRPELRAEIGLRNRERALELFGIDLFVNKYLKAFGFCGEK